ncbi:hypothetical protein DL770_000592 [Monosporascus sp. CRB-9-2]|nr:hypothetical protein DL770_000592 [Monosporascus sp. CRB-9-2]
MALEGFRHRVTRSQAQAAKAYKEPPAADLPGLFPVHDGSYGVNTLINLDSSSKRGRGTRNAGLANESDEDRLFMRRVHGKDGKRFDMKSNIRKAINQTIRNAEKDHNPDAGVLNPDEQPAGQPPGQPAGQPSANPPGQPPAKPARHPPAKPIDTPNTGNAQNADAPNAENARPAYTSNPGNTRNGNERPNGPPQIHPSYGSDKSALQPQAPYLPRYNGPISPVSGAGRDIFARNPPYTRPELHSQGQYDIVNNRHPSDPPIERAPPPYGMPTGRGSSVPYSSPSRPDTSRSFNTESGLFGSATLQTPKPDPGAPNPRTGWTADDELNFRLTGRLPSQESVAFGMRDPSPDQLPYGPIPLFLQPAAHFGDKGRESGGAPEKANTPQPGSKNPGRQPKKNRNEQNPDNPPADNYVSPQRQRNDPNQANPDANRREQSTPEGSNNAPPDSPVVNNPEPPVPEPANNRDPPKRRSPNENRADQNAPAALSTAELTADELRHIQEMIRDMRLPRRSNRHAPQPLPALSLATLSPAEIDATKAMVASMGRDQATVQKIMESLNTAERRPGSNRSGSRPGSRHETPKSQNAPHPDPHVQSGEALYPGLPPARGNGNVPPVPPNRRPLHNNPSPPSAPDRDVPPVPLQGRMHWITQIWQTSAHSFFRWVWKALTAAAIMFIMWAFFGVLTKLSRGESLQWYGLSQPRANIVQLLPDSSGVADALASPRKFLSGDEWKFVWGESDTGAWRKGGSADGKLLDEVQKHIPKVVHVEKDKNGKFKISQDFWHALKGLIKSDEDLFKGCKGCEIDEEQLRVIKSRLESEGLLATGPKNKNKDGISTKDVERIVDKSVARSWGDWLERNQEELKKTGDGVSRDEFMRLLREEIRPYQSQVRQELEGMDERIKGIVQELAKLRDSSAAPSGMTKPEIEALVKATVKKVVDKAKLDAAVNGQIKGHASDVVFNQVNFFGIGSGALIDPLNSSPPWTLPKNLFKSKKWMDKDGYKPRPRTSALFAWSEEGDCFCAGPDRRTGGAGPSSIAVITSRNIIPQHLVVEHILPGATLDPGAMPKDIEVWAYIEDVTLRKEVTAFSESQFPNTPREVALNEGFVKVGHFLYEDKDYGDGVQVFKMSDQLTEIGAITNHLVVRAVSNYGADHTCFYRLRMYGDVVEREENPQYASMKWF